MKSLGTEAAGQVAVIAHTVPDVLAATAQSLPSQPNARMRARAFAEPLIGGETLDSGENALAHADAVAAILQTIGGSEAMQAASYLVYTCAYLNRPQEVIAKAFGDNFAELAIATTKLVRVQKRARGAWSAAAPVDAPTPLDDPVVQTENVRKMLLAFSRDLRVVMLRLASRLQTLRHFASIKKRMPRAQAAESLQVFAPLANRLGIWEIKWEIEDLSFRFLEPDTYRDVARMLDEKRVERELQIEQLRTELEQQLRAQGIGATVQGRPKHIYSIVKKMRGKGLDFDRVFDVRALRVVVPELQDCYTALAWVHERFTPVEQEFDDYIAKPKANGYRSLHMVVRDAAAKPIEIQIRTQAMHNHAEHGMAAHWAYKEAGTKGYLGVSADSAYDAKIAVLRQLLAWERDLSGVAAAQGLLEDHIYVLTPQASVIELPQGATPVDFAYSVHTSLGHRCRGARIDGQLMPLNTALKNGQTVQIIAAREGGPSRDWLSTDGGYLVSHRARAKVRAWFNALAQHQTAARGREAVEKLLQREGKTAWKLDDVAAQVGFQSAEDLFGAVGKDAFSLRQIEQLLRPSAPPSAEEPPRLKIATPPATARDGVLVVGLDSLLTELAKCCRPAPPDRVSGFVTRGRGVSVHRSDCSNFRDLASRSPERVIEVDWGTPPVGVERSAVYPVDVAVEAHDRQGLLRDISDVFAQARTNVIGVQTQTIRGTAWMTFTVEVADSARLEHTLGVVAQVDGVRRARRR